MASMICVARYYEPAEAVVAASYLRAHGLHVLLPEYHHATQAWSHVFAIQGLRVWTLDPMAQDALLLLKEVEAADASDTKQVTKIGAFGLHATVMELVIAALAFAVSGLPLPLWMRRSARIR